MNKIENTFLMANVKLIEVSAGPSVDSEDNSGEHALAFESV